VDPPPNPFFLLELFPLCASFTSSSFSLSYPERSEWTTIK
jgi:hypothetical protein